jgi:8-oxo-dGTP diphosphatase
MNVIEPARKARPPLLRVTAAVIEEDGKVLIARRKKGDRFEGRWEFPGGKVEPGELPEDCLKREIREELGIDVEVGDVLCSLPFRTADLAIRLLAYKAERLAGEVACLDHEEIRWVDPAELDAFEMTEPDRRVVAAIYPRREGRP